MKYMKLLKMYRIPFRFVLHPRTSLRIVLSTISVALWISVLYYSVSDDTKAAILSYLGVVSTVFTMKYAFCGIRNMNAFLIKVVDFSALFLLLAGFCLMILSKFQTTAFYSICLGMFIRKMRYEIKQFTRADNTHLYINGEVSSEVSQLEVEFRIKDSLNEVDRRKNEFIHPHANTPPCKKIESLEQNLERLKENEAEDSAIEISQKQILVNLDEKFCLEQEDNKAEKSVIEITQHRVLNNSYSNLNRSPVLLSESLKDEETVNYLVKELSKKFLQELIDQGENNDTSTLKVAERQEDYEAEKYCDFVQKRVLVQPSNTNSFDAIANEGEYLSEEIDLNRKKTKHILGSELSISSAKCFSEQTFKGISTIHTTTPSNLNFKRSPIVVAESFQSNDEISLDSGTNSDLEIEKHFPTRNTSTDSVANTNKINESKSEESADMVNMTPYFPTFSNVENVVNKIDLSFIYAVSS